MKVDNAIILAAGTSSRFAPLSYERPKPLLEVRGEVLIERQIHQLREVGIPDIYVVVGYKADQLAYLEQDFGVHFIHNHEYLSRNNHSSIWAMREVLANSFVCSADNYFTSNPFQADVDDAYYAAVYADGPTHEWCLEEDEDGYICRVHPDGGSDAWYMMGHTFWSEDYSRNYLHILEREYDEPGTADKLWELIYADHLDVLKMRIRRYPADAIHEFDALDELRTFDESYWDDTRSLIIKDIARRLDCTEREIHEIHPVRATNTSADGFTLLAPGGAYTYLYADGSLEKN